MAATPAIRSADWPSAAARRLPPPPVGWWRRLAGAARRAAAPPVRRCGRELAAMAAQALSQAVFLAAAAILLYPSLVHGALRWQDDTKYFYFPLLSTLGAALHEGRLPLWEPGIFGGYPLFADGESGMLYPPHLILFRLLDPATGLIALRLVRFYAAGAFTYAYLRATGTGRTGAVIGGLIFMLSGFMVGQVVHENLDDGMIWLPLALAFVERAVRQVRGQPGFRRRRYAYATMAGVALAMQALAVHVQVCVFSALLIGPYLGWRALFGTAGGPRLPGRLVLATGIGAVMALVGAGLAAVQLLPLLDLAGRSARGHGITAAAATINSVTPFQLLTIVFPHLLRRPDGLALTYWVEWEVALYVGVPALLLAAVALALRRDRFVVFFAGTAVLALVLATGRYGPGWVVDLTEDLLGEHGLRSPGRFAFLWCLSAAILAGLGADWLDRGRGTGRVSAPRVGASSDGPDAPASLQALESPGAPNPPIAATDAAAGQQAAAGARWGRRAGATSHRWLCHLLGAAADAYTVATLAVVAGFAAGLLLAARAGHAWLAAHPVTTRAWLEQHYIRFDPTPSARLKVSADDVYRGLVAALDPHNPATAVWVLSVVGGYGLLVAWLVAGRAPLPGARGRVVAAALRALAVLVVGIPLLAAAEQAHPAAAVAAIEPDSGAALYLRDQLAPPGMPAAERPLYRVYTAQPVYLGRTDVEPNALLPLGIREAGGYSSLSTTVNLAYAWAFETTMGRLLDVWNARYYLWPNAPDPLPSYELTSFHPQRPLLAGTGANSGAAGSFRVPSVLGENVRVVAALRDAWDVPPGAVVAWVTATDDTGQQQRWPLRAGIEVLEATQPPPPEAVEAARRGETGGRPLPVFSFQEYGPDGQPYEVWLYYATLPLPQPRTITRLTVQVVPVAGTQASLRLYGLGVGQPDWWVHNVVWSDRERFTLVYQDDEIRVYRNEQALPRAYLVPLAVRAPAALHIKEMAERSFDPARIVLVDAPAGAGPPAATAAALEGPSESFEQATWFTPPLEGAAAPDVDPTPDQVVATDDRGWRSRSPAGTTTIVRYDAGSVVAEVEAPADAWLFLADTFDPAWRAYVDGAERPLRLANAMFRAVAVPAGYHRVAFRYEPAPLQRGAAVSLLTGTAVLLWLCVSGAWAALTARTPSRQAQR